MHLNYYGTCVPLQSSPSGSDVPAETVRNELTCSPYLLVLSRHGVTTASAVTRGHTDRSTPRAYLRDLELNVPTSPTHNLR